MWSSRFLNSVKGLGHQGVVASSIPEGTADAAILNLADPNVAEVAAELSLKGIYTIAHAGHKEKELLELGKEIHVDRIATNSEITNKIEALLNEAKAQKS